jgi:predicted alpha/beta superfamily hydrolase
MTESTLTISPFGPSAETVQASITFYNRIAPPPVLEIHHEEQVWELPFTPQPDDVRIQGEYAWCARPWLPAAATWRFRIRFPAGTYAPPHDGGSYDYYESGLHTLWIQEGEIYAYRPKPMLSESRVVKVRHFFGRLRRRPLYIYLPRGYDQHTERDYPVLYMHDGQNCFEAYARDSYAGTWHADKTADRLIATGQIPECLIVGVANGGPGRISEYLPPYTAWSRPPDSDGHGFKPIPGRANLTRDYYLHDVVPFVQQFYRARRGRDHTATCGSSMGGLFSVWLAWEHPEFARHHAALSSSFWITATGEGESRRLEMVERLRHGTPRDIRLWLDSGTRTAPDYGDDSRHDTLAARDALLANGYVEGKNLRYLLDEGATHSESAWAARFDQVLRFLFALEPAP